MKYINEILTAVSVITLLGAVSCNKEKAVETAGSAIRFGVSTVYENGPATKTEYSGKDQDNNDISSTSTSERIDWLPTDQIRIGCYHDTPVSGRDEFEYADYQIELSGSGTDQTHSADLSPIGNGLQWGEGGHDFIALYPSPAQMSEDQAQLTSLDKEGVVSIIPATQTATLSGQVFKPDMNYAYMYAIASGVAKGSDVQLNFKPLVTTLAFTLLTKAGDAITSNLTSVKLSSTQSDAYLTGTFSAIIDKEDGFQPLDPENNVIGGNEITINLPDGGVQLSTTEAYTVTFLTLPMDQTNLTLTLNFADETKRTLELKHDGTWITVPACKKTYIWNLDAPLTVDTYTIDPLQAITLTYAGGSSPLSTTFKSYKTSGGTNSSVAFKFQYAESETGPWTDGLPGWLTGAGIDYTGSTSGQTLNITMAEQTNSGENPHTAALKGATPKSGFDLSTVNVSTGATVASTTANCYVVQASGSYKFPLVYGNALKNGSANDAAYHRQQSTATGAGYLEYYLDHNDDPINNNKAGGTNYAKNSIYIAERFSGKGAINAELLWTDAPGLVNNVAIIGSGTAAYITFEVPSETICQGNALIAVKVGDKIAWSWHIWVTDEDLSETYPGSNLFRFPAVNLGWCDGETATYAERTCYVKAVQTVSGGAETAPVKITQSAGTVTTGGNNPYYQWGRKDPFMASNGTGNTNKTYYGTNKPTDVKRPATLTLGGAIQKPYERYYRTSSPYDWCSITYYNTWNSTIAGYGNDQLWRKEVTKTIYDPSPVGYKMPPQAAYSSLGYSTQGSRGSQGYSFKVSDFWGEYLFPASGYRDHSSAALSRVWYDVRYWSAVPFDNNDGYSLSEYSLTGYSYRSYGFAVRPVQE